MLTDDVIFVINNTIRILLCVNNGLQIICFQVKNDGYMDSKCYYCFAIEKFALSTYTHLFLHVILELKNSHG